jgi:hypothetical protein
MEDWDLQSYSVAKSRVFKTKGALQMSKLMDFHKVAISLAMFAVITMASAVVARADTTQIVLNQINIAGFTGPFATVDINRYELDDRHNYLYWPFKCPLSVPDRWRPGRRPQL